MASIALSLALALLAAWGVARAQVSPPAASADASRPTATTEASAAAQLSALLDEDLAAGHRRFPLGATVRGVPGYNHLLTDLSAAALARERARERDALSRLERIDTAALRGQDRVSYELLVERMQSAVERQRFPASEALVLGTLGGIHALMPRAAQVIPFRTAKDYRDYVARIDAMPKLVDETVALLASGMRTGWMHPVAVVDRAVAAIDLHLVENADESVLMGPFRQLADAVAPADREALVAAARRAIAGSYQPAMRRYRAFIVEKYRPGAPAEAGLGALPGGREYYDFLIRSGVVRGTSAAEIHDLGLAEVARIRGEIGAIAKRTGYDGTVAAFVRHLRTEPGFHFASADAVLAAYRAVGQRVDPKLGTLFHSLPRMPYAVRAMTPSEAASSRAANYLPGSLALGTSGYFTINALGYANEPTWRVETVFLHETVPGHHLQIARAAEMDSLHPWRRVYGGTTGYGEGWALYAEKLGFELGLFQDPYQHYGHLQAELFRAARLVVDTGIHAYGWKRDRAVDYMVSEGGLDADFAASEVDRYFSNPSQALGYMLGQRKFLELRARAEKVLGPKFDIRDFHAVVIDNGRVPLAVLEKLVGQWIAAGGGRPAP